VFIYYAPEEEDKFNVKLVQTIKASIGEKALRARIPTDYLIYAEGVRGLNGGGGAVPVEVKGGPDMMKCVQHTNRHLNQLRQALDQFGMAYLFIKDRVKPDENGVACTPRYRQGLVPIHPYKGSRETIQFDRWDNHLNTLRVNMGVEVIECEDQQHVARRLLNLAYWWDTPPELHKSHLGKYRPVNLIGMENGERVKSSLLARMMVEVEGVGEVRAKKVEEKAKEVGASVRDVVNWGREEWMSVEGIGKKGAEKIEEELGGR
jgi:hypothetical protein